MATEFVTAIKANEIPVDGVKAIDVRGTRIAVANVGGTTTRSTTRARMNSARLLKKGNWLARPSRARATVRSSTCGREGARPSSDTAGQGVSRPGRGDALEIEV